MFIASVTQVTRALSNPYRTKLSTNRGGCSQSYRWKYDLYIQRAFQAKSEKAHPRCKFLKNAVSAVDMCSVENIPDLIDNGVDSRQNRRS